MAVGCCWSQRRHVVGQVHESCRAWAGDIPTLPGAQGLGQGRETPSATAPCSCDTGRATLHLPMASANASRLPPSSRGKTPPGLLLPFPIIRRTALLNQSVPGVSNEAGTAPLCTEHTHQAGIAQDSAACCPGCPRARCAHLVNQSAALPPQTRHSAFLQHPGNVLLGSTALQKSRLWWK